MKRLKGSRKAITGLVILIVGVAVTIVKGDVPPGLLSLLQALYAAFILGNSAEYVSGAAISRNTKNEKD